MLGTLALGLFSCIAHTLPRTSVTVASFLNQTFIIATMNYTQRYPNPQAPPKPPRADGTVFRVTGIPLTATVDELHDALSELLSEGITVNTKHTTISPSCHDKTTQNALIQFTPYPPLILTNLPTNDCYQIQFGNTDINIDKDFYGLTQLYPTLGAVDAE